MNDERATGEVHTPASSNATTVDSRLELGVGELTQAIKELLR